MFGLEKRSWNVFVDLWISLVLVSLFNAKAILWSVTRPDHFVWLSRPMNGSVVFHIRASWLICKEVLCAMFAKIVFCFRFHPGIFCIVMLNIHILTVNYMICIFFIKKNVIRFEFLICCVSVSMRLRSILDNFEWAIST